MKRDELECKATLSSTFRDESVQGVSSGKVLAVLSLSHFSQHVYEGRSVLYTYIMNSLGLSYTQIGVAAGVASTLTGLLQMVFGLAGRIIPRRLILGLGNILMSLSSFGIGVSNSFLDFASSQATGGLGIAPEHPVSVSIISERFKNKEISTPIGIFYGLGYIGNIIGPIVLTAIALAYEWRSALFVLTVIPFATGILLMAYLRKDRFSGKAETAKVGYSLWADAKSALRIKGAVALIAAYAFLAGGTSQTVIGTFLPLFLRNGLHLDQLQSSFIYSLAMLGGVVGTILFGKYANNLGYLKTTMVCTGIASLSFFLLSHPAVSDLALTLNLVLVGFATFPLTSLMQSTLSSFSGPSQRDILIGLHLTVGFGFSSLWSAFLGFLIDLYGMFVPAWYLMSGLCILSQVFLMLAYKHRE